MKQGRTNKTNKSNNKQTKQHNTQEIKRKHNQTKNKT